VPKDFSGRDGELLVLRKERKKGKK